ncbi:MAG: hypothetical protein HS122_16060 [Opitutaceae bacterium]|nr:hypothetical protein [Opitutaceae bacterium]
MALRKDSTGRTELHFAAYISVTSSLIRQRDSGLRPAIALPDQKPLAKSHTKTKQKV